jgi:hypothetical protein
LSPLAAATQTGSEKLAADPFDSHVWVHTSLGLALLLDANIEAILFHT